MLGKLKPEADDLERGPSESLRNAAFGMVRTTGPRPAKRLATHAILGIGKGPAEIGSPPALRIVIRAALIKTHAAGRADLAAEVRPKLQRVNEFLQADEPYKARDAIEELLAKLPEADHG